MATVKGKTKSPVQRQLAYTGRMKKKGMRPVQAWLDAEEFELARQNEAARLATQYGVTDADVLRRGVALVAGTAKVLPA